MRLHINEVIKLAKLVAFDSGITLPDSNYLVDKIKKKCYGRLPYLAQTDEFQLWLDLDYIACSYTNSIKVKYIYTTRLHALRESKDILSRLNKVKDNATRVMLQDLYVQLVNFREHKYYYIVREYKKRLRTNL